MMCVRGIVESGFSYRLPWLMPLITLLICGWAAAAIDQDKVVQRGVGDLPVREVPPNLLKKSDFLTIIYTGDAGWGETDLGIARSLAAKGTGVANVNSLRYFWKKRTPESAARDLERIIVHYSAAWQADRVILIGYSFGANVMPFMINRLSREMRSRIDLVVLISPGYQADFTFHFGSWTGVARKDSPKVLPEVMKLCGQKVYCFYGLRDHSSSGPQFPPGVATVIPLPTGHRVKRGYAPIVNAIMTEVGLAN